jgi:hypothetical protein
MRDWEFEREGQDDSRVLVWLSYGGGGIFKIRSNIRVVGGTR